MNSKTDSGNRGLADRATMMRRFKNNFTEAMYHNQINKCEKNKNLKSNEYKELRKEEYSKELKNVLSLNNLSITHNESWEKNLFDSDVIFKEETPIIKMKWEETTVESSTKGVDVTNCIYRSKNTLNMKNFSVELSLTCFLAGESTCWIFNRVNDYFDEFAAAFKIEKAENSPKVFFSVGAFVKDSQDNLIFKVFVKEQLIDFSKSKNKSYIENDICFIKAQIVDTCDDSFLARVYLNDSKTDNMITANFLIPNSERRRVMIAGTGEKCLISNFIAKNIDLKRQTITQPVKIPESVAKTEETSKRNGNCGGCSVY